MSEARERKALRYQQALEANGELRAFLKGYRAAAGDDPAIAEWSKFIEDRVRILMNAAFILGEELEEGTT